jgi:hypothetical protein
MRRRLADDRKSWASRGKRAPLKFRKQLTRAYLLRLTRVSRGDPFDGGFHGLPSARYSHRWEVWEWEKVCCLNRRSYCPRPIYPCIYRQCPSVIRLLPLHQRLIHKPRMGVCFSDQCCLDCFGRDIFGCCCVGDPYYRNRFDGLHPGYQFGHHQHPSGGYPAFGSWGRGLGWINRGNRLAALDSEWRLMWYKKCFFNRF